MKWKDTQDPQILNEKPEDDYFNEEQYATFAEDKRPGDEMIQERKQGPSVLKITIGLMVAVVILVLFLMPGLFSGTDGERVLVLERKIEKLEQRLNEFTAVDEKVTRIWEQAKSFEKFKDRFDRSEASMSLRMDHLAMSLDAVQKSLAQKAVTTKAAPPKKAEPKKTEPKPETKPAAKKTTPQYHVVEKGETLYRIGLKYNLKPDELIRLNKLPANPVIKPGQKLIVSN